MDLTEFLLARYDEDEAQARYALNYCPDDGPFVRWDSERVLEECDAKRRIVALHECHTWKTISTTRTWTVDHCHVCSGRFPKDESDWPCPTLRLLALPYKDHPDYDESWSA